MAGARESGKKIKKRKKKDLMRKYRINAKGFKVIIEKLKQKSLLQNLRN